MNIDYNYYKSYLLGYLNSSTRILEPIIDKIEMLEKHLIKIKFSYLGENLQAIIVYDII